MTPREHAKIILDLETWPERRARLAECPEWMRGLVRKHVENALAIRQSRAEAEDNG